MTHAPVVVVGSCNMDLVTRAQRLPERGETIGGVSFGTYLGGKGLNQAVAARRMGAQVAMIARVGADDFGDRIRESLRDEGIDAAQVQPIAGESSGTALIVVEEGSGDNMIVAVPGANGRLAPADIDAAADLLRRSRVVLLQLEVPLATLLHAARIAHAGGATVILTPAPVQPLPDDLLRVTDILVPNAVEIRRLLESDVDPVEGARRLIARGCGAVVITQGERGATLVTHDGDQHVPPFAVAAVDTVAAGDAFVGALAAGLAEDRDLDESLRYAAAAGALAVTQPGALPSLPTRDAVESFMRQRG
jgi:ribokinase